MTAEDEAYLVLNAEKHRVEEGRMAYVVCAQVSATWTWCGGDRCKRPTDAHISGP